MAEEKVFPLPDCQSLYEEDGLSDFDDDGVDGDDLEEESPDKDNPDEEKDLEEELEEEI